MRIPFEALKTSKFEFQIGSVLTVRGPDSVSYLNSQVTSNLKNLEVGHFQHSCILDLAGKVIAPFILCLETPERAQLIFHQEQKDKLLARLEKFHISEDLEFEESDQIAKLLVNHPYIENTLKGTFFRAGDQILIDQKGIDTSDHESFKALCMLTGTPRWGKEVIEGELVNNTTLDELAVSYTKGCYPGQETVAKVDSRRGAAFKPVLLHSNSKLDLSPGIIKKNGKKIGEIRTILNINKELFAWTLLNRECRIDKTLLNFSLKEHEFEMSVNYLPYIFLREDDIAQDYYDAAVAAFQSEDNELAIELFHKAIEINPTFEDAYESLGVLFGREGNFEKAIEMMEKLKAINSKCLMAYTNLSLYHMKIGNIETAEKYKSDATLLNFETLGNEAKAKREQEEIKLKKKHERDRREQMFLQVLDIDELDAMANNGMGEIMFEKDSFKEAKSFFEKAIEGDKKYSVAYLGLAKTYMKLGELANLESTLKLGIKIASTNGDLMPANEMQSMLLKL